MAIGGRRLLLGLARHTTSSTHHGLFKSLAMLLGNPISVGAEDSVIHWRAAGGLEIVWGVRYFAGVFAGLPLPGARLPFHGI